MTFLFLIKGVPDPERDGVISVVWSSSQNHKRVIVITMSQYCGNNMLSLFSDKLLIDNVQNKETKITTKHENLITNLTS